MIQAASDRYLAAECGIRCQASPVMDTEGPRDGVLTVFRVFTHGIIAPIPNTHPFIRLSPTIYDLNKDSRCSMRIKETDPLFLARLFHGLATVP
jgi:hypothetical protein